MITDTQTESSATMRAEEKLRRDKQLLAKEKAKDREKKRKEENHHKYMMGGIIVKYFPEGYHFEEYELNEILSAALATTECQQIIARIKEENAGNGSWNNDDPEGGDDEE